MIQSDYHSFGKFHHILISGTQEEVFIALLSGKADVMVYTGREFRIKELETR